MTPRQTMTRDDGRPRTAVRTRPARRTLRDVWLAGDRALQYTIIAVVSILLAGAIIVPMTMPDAPPAQDRASLLAERYLASLPADADKPALQKVVADYGSTGGDACTAKAADTYKGMFIKYKTASGKTGSRLDRAALADTTRMMETYCPAQAEALQQHADKRAGTGKAKRKNA